MHQLDFLEKLLSLRGIAGVTRPIHMEVGSGSVVGAVEFSAMRWSWWRAHGGDLLTELPRTAPGSQFADGWTHLLPQDLARATGLVRGNGPAGGGEIHEIPPMSEGWAAGDSFSMFQERFKNRLLHCGVPSSWAAALAGALAEVASNAVEHARSSLPPVAAYEVTPDDWSFCVTDVGCGVLESLRRNPAYANSGDDVSAVRLALRDGVSATGQPNRGHGFSHLFKALANRMCAIRLRSTRAVGTWDGQSPAANLMTLMVAPARPGFHLGVSSRLAT